MKALLLFTLLLTTFNLYAAPDCNLKQELGKNKHYTCDFLGGKKRIHLLELTGDMKETAYAHGYFLANEIADGAIDGIIKKKNRALAKLSPDELKQYNSLSKCVLRNYKSSVSDDFIYMSYALQKGLTKRGVNKYSKQDILEANMMVELSIFFDGLEHAMEIDESRTKRRLMGTCPGLAIKTVFKSMFKKMGGFFKKMKFGCTGIAASGPYTQDGSLFLSRNFDTGLLGYFEKHPLLILHHPKNGLSYVGMGTAGLHYPGGISGFNEAGIAASLHELQTTEYKTSYLKEDPMGGEMTDEFGEPMPVNDVAPYMLNKLLMTAKTMDEAIKFITERKHFGAWTVFLGDSKTNEIASVEFTGRHVRVSRRVKDSALAQSNHFFHPDILKNAFEYSYNKSLETRSRYEHVTDSLNKDKGTIDAQWMINTISGHYDHYVGKRSFGRTTTKVYTSQTHVMNPGPNEFWFSLAEIYPTTSSTFAGFKLNFHAPAHVPFFTFLGETKAQTEELTGTPNWNESLGHYVQAYLKSNEGDMNGVLTELDRAVELAEMDNVTEIPYHHIRGRFLVKMAAAVHKDNPTQALHLLNKALEDYQTIINARDEGVAIHDYQLSLAFLWHARIVDLFRLMGTEQLSSEISYELSRELMASLPNIYPSRYDFSKLMASAKTPYNWEQAAHDDILMGTIE